MAIPNFITNTLANVAGEFANTTGPFISANINLPDFPSDLVSLPSDFKLPTVDEFQKKMLQVILTEDGRSELFVNPFESELEELDARLSALAATPGGDGVSNPLASVANDLKETLTYFKSHTDRLCGAVEVTDEDELQLPTLERALAVGSSLNSLHQMLDDKATNAPQLSLFSCFFSGRKQINSIKEILELPDSNIVAQKLSELSSNMIGSMEADVKNYTVGLKKLKRVSIANMVFNSRNKQVESELFKQITTPLTQSLFAQNEAALGDESADDDPNAKSSSSSGSTRPWSEIEAEIAGYPVRDVWDSELVGTERGHIKRVRLVANVTRTYHHRIPAGFRGMVHYIIAAAPQEYTVGRSIRTFWISKTPNGKAIVPNSWGAPAIESLEGELGIFNVEIPFALKGGDEYYFNIKSDVNILQVLQVRFLPS